MEMDTLKRIERVRFYTLKRDIKKRKMMKGVYLFSVKRDTLKKDWKVLFQVKRNTRIHRKEKQVNGIFILNTWKAILLKGIEKMLLFIKEKG